MRKTRLYVDEKLEQGESIRLEGDRAHYLSRVLRLEAGADLVVFNGKGGEYEARLEHAEREAVWARVGAFNPIERESPLNITLVQGISRGERMDFTVQKAVELGVHTIAPVTTERSAVRLDGARRSRRLEHWRGIVVNACQQCGRTRIPSVQEITSLDHWLKSASRSAVSRLVLSPRAILSADDVEVERDVVLLIGPEGGFSQGELERVSQSGFRALSLGPRILRTETAAVAALTALQLKRGDLSLRA